MNPRLLRATLAVSCVVALLFAGRWTSSALAERWWAAEISPEAVRFLGSWSLLTGLLEAGGILVAVAWFIGHLLLVYRAIGSVQIHRRLGNLEIQEAVNLRSLAVVSVVGGLLLGLLAGRGAGSWAPAILMAKRDLTYGELDPILGRDFGYYVARLPLLEQAQNAALLLVVLGLVVTLAAYAVIGALRWSDRKLAINDHARWHLGVMAILLGLVLAWGYALEPAEIAGGALGSLHDGLFPIRRLIALVLTGTALAASLVSAWWAWRGGHTLLGSVWGLLAGALLLGHYVIPALASPRPLAAVPEDKRRRLDQLAYGMTNLRDGELLRAEGAPARPVPAALLAPTIVAEATGEDSSRVVALDRVALPAARGVLPAWLVVRSRAAGAARLAALRDDRTQVDGRPESLPDSDLPSAGLAEPVGPGGAWPGAAETVVDTGASGVPVGSGARRIILAWALQTTSVLGPLAPNSRVSWHLDPSERLARLAPFATWGAPRPRIFDQGLVWLVDGYLPLPRFPGSSRLEWRDQSIGGLYAAFLGVVEARRGRVRIFLRHGAGEYGERWRGISDGLIEPATAIPTEVLRAISYPPELLEAQLRVLAQPHWGIGTLAGRPASVGVSGPPQEAMWKPDLTGVGAVVPFLTSSHRQVAAVVHAVVADGWEQLRVVRVDSLLTLPEPVALQGTWARFPTFLQLRDSVERAGGRLESAPIHYWVDSAGLGAYEVQFARQGRSTPALVWISVAHADRRGAGHDLGEAWENLLGLSAPLIGTPDRPATLAELKRLVALAERALKDGDIETFGRHWAAILRLLGRP